MSEIEKGLRANQMRARMEDKAIIENTGSMYMRGSDGTVELQAGGLGTVLCSKGSNAVLQYQQLPTDSFSDTSVSKAKIANVPGLVIASGDNNKKYFTVKKITVSGDYDDIEIWFNTSLPPNN